MNKATTIILVAVAAAVVLISVYLLTKPAPANNELSLGTLITIAELYEGYAA